MLKAWYAYNGVMYNGEFPPYGDLKGTAWYDKLMTDLPNIKKDVLAFLDADGVKTKAYFNTSIYEGATWEAVAFFYWNIPNKMNMERGRSVLKHFENIPGLISVSISILQPGTHIKPHVGDTDAIYRLHVPILIPGQLPECGLKVGEIDRSWTDNDALVFCDAYKHEAWNDTAKPRIVLIADVVREEFLPQTDEICTEVLSWLGYQYVSNKFKIIKSFPVGGKILVRKILKWRIFAVVYNRLGKM